MHRRSSTIVKETADMSQYMISVWHDDTYVVDFESPENQAKFAKVDAYNNELQEAGAWVFGAGLHPAETATVLRPTATGDVSMTDGPYAETKEQMGGFWIIEVADFDAALDWAKRAAVACEEILEIRPLQGE
jgi:hypothetical protein